MQCKIDTDHEQQPSLTHLSQFAVPLSPHHRAGHNILATPCSKNFAERSVMMKIGLYRNRSIQILYSKLR